MTNSILITGASGLVGSRLTEVFLTRGYKVSHLGRSNKTGPVPAYVWNVDAGTMDQDALQDIDTIIHLAGAGVADERWTAKRKKEILDSRIKSSALLYEMLEKSEHKVKTVISASAIGYYGGLKDARLLTEESKPGNDFLSDVVVQWEQTVNRIASIGIKVITIRTGIVLSPEGGALGAMKGPINLGIGSPLGSGKQIISWIHLDDLCDIYVKAVEDPSMRGSFNAVSPNPVSNEEMTRQIAKRMNRPLLAPNVPRFALRIALGEMADSVVTGSNVSSAKIISHGFNFQFKRIEEALDNLLPS